MDIFREFVLSFGKLLRNLLQESTVNRCEIDF